MGTGPRAHRLQKKGGSKTLNPLKLRAWRLSALVVCCLAPAAWGQAARAQGAAGTIASIPGTDGCSNLTTDAAGNLYFESWRGVEKLTPGSDRITTEAPQSLIISGAGIALDASGNLYIAQGAYGPLQNTVKMVAAGSHAATTVAGTGEGANGLTNRIPGPALKAIVDNPDRLAVDAAGDLYISHGGGIWKLTVASGILSGFQIDWGSLRDTASILSAAGVRYMQIKGLQFDREGNLLIADANRSVVWRVVPATGKVARVAGSIQDGFWGDGGSALAAKLSFPVSVAVDGGGNLFIADQGNNRVRRVDGGSGTITTVAGNGTARNVYVHVTLPDGNTTDRYQKADDGDGGPADAGAGERSGQRGAGPGRQPVRVRRDCTQGERRGSGALRREERRLRDAIDGMRRLRAARS